MLKQLLCVFLVMALSARAGTAQPASAVPRDPAAGVLGYEASDGLRRLDAAFETNREPRH